MNNIIGTIISAIVTDENEKFYFVQKSGATLALAKSEGGHNIGEVITGFAYPDRADKLRLTTQEQTVTQESFGWGVVTQVRKDLGAFVETNLPDKDIVVSMDDLPEDKQQWPKKGDQLYIKLVLDKKNRLWGHLAWAEDFQAIAAPAYDNMQNEKLRALVYRNKETGTFVYLPDNKMLGFVHPSERYAVPRIGEELQVRVIGFNARNKSLNLSSKPRAFEMLDADSQMILAYLEEIGGKMPLNDKSSPEAVKEIFAISKGQFKKALGGLMKAGKVKQNMEGTKLI